MLRELRQLLIYLTICIFLVLAILAIAGKYKEMSVENDRLKNNLEYYKVRLNEKDSNAIVYRQTVKELKYSKDTLLRHVEFLRESLKLKPKNIKTVVYSKSVVRDTIIDTVTIEPNFYKKILFNDQTSIEISKEDSLITVIPNIENDQTILVYTEEKYKYKNWFSRLIHFNFSKTRLDKYTIENSNPIIKTTRSKVINMEK